MVANAVASEKVPSKNIVLNSELKTYDKISFLDENDREININEFKGKLILLNFWAVWCAPCKEEMPSLDKLQINKDLDNLEIFPVNVGNDSVGKS